jgi:threonine dehydrogenase-like Zn-dependent dehydrogenase
VAYHVAGTGIQDLAPADTGSTVTETSMTAAIFAGEGKLEIGQRPVPRLENSTDVILRVEACGVCGTDLKILSTPQGHPGTPGIVLGHEFVGVAQDVGSDVSSLSAGDRVVVAPNVSCGQCRWCLRGVRVHCAQFTTHGIYLDGGLAPYVRVPATACHRISAAVPRHIAALAEPLSTVVHGARRAGVFPGETAVVVGGGPIGLLFTAVLRHAGATVLVIEPTPARAELALAMGASAAVPPNSNELRTAVNAATDGFGADVVVDAVGSQLNSALELTRKGGRVVLFGVNSAARTSLAQFDITRNEIEVLGSFVGQDVFPAAVRLLEQGAIDFEPLVTHRISLHDFPATMDDLRSGKAVKVQVEFA